MHNLVPMRIKYCSFISSLMAFRSYFDRLRTIFSNQVRSLVQVRVTWFMASTSGHHVDARYIIHSPRDTIHGANEINEPPAPPRPPASAIQSEDISRSCKHQQMTPHLIPMSRRSAVPRSSSSPAGLAGLLWLMPGCKFYLA